MSGLILASSSKYRQSLLARLRIPFTSVAPNIDESIDAGEQPLEYVARLAEQKAILVAKQYSNHWVLGSDQIAILGSQIIGKPGNHENAVKQLESFSAQQIEFVTAVCLVGIEQQFNQNLLSKVTVKFRQLTNHQIENYLIDDRPYDCAGSFKIESKGITLFESVKSDDPTSLEGLPLISVSSLFRAAGIF